MSVRIAAPQQPKLKPAFKVEELEGTREVTLHGFDTKGRKTIKTVEVPAGFLVTFAKGHSIRVANEEELHRLGFDQTIPLVDVDGDDEPQGMVSNPIATTVANRSA